MDFKTALDLVSAIYQEHNITVGEIYDTPTHWIFFPETNGAVRVGGSAVKIEKVSGEQGDFFLPDEANFKLWNHAVKIERPE